MLYYDRVDVNKTSKSKGCDICFLNKGFKFQPNVCNGYHDLVMMSLNLSDIAILNIYKDELKEIDIKNSACYNFDNTMKVRDIDFSDILLDKKSNKTRKNILIYDISYKYFIDEKPLRIRFDKIDGFIKIYDGIRYLVLFGYERYDAMFNRNR